MRSILYPRPMGFKFYRDAMKFILLLACVACVGMTYIVVILIQMGVSACVLTCVCVTKECVCVWLCAYSVCVCVIRVCVCER